MVQHWVLEASEVEQVEGWCSRHLHLHVCAASDTKTHPQLRTVPQISKLGRVMYYIFPRAGGCRAAASFKQGTVQAPHLAAHVAVLIGLHGRAWAQQPAPVHQELVRMLPCLPAPSACSGTGLCCGGALSHAGS